MPTTSEVTSSELPSWAKPYYPDLLKSAANLASHPYQPYGGQRFAGYNPLETGAYAGLGSLGPSSYLGGAAGMATSAGEESARIGANFQPMQYNPLNVSYMTAQAPQLQQYQMGPAERVGTQSYTGQNVQDYMSPYMQNVVEQQKRSAIQDYSRQVPGMQAAAARAGARGGTREALMRSEAQRNLQGQLQGLQAAGSQQAFQNAQQQFNAQQQANMQAQLANQQAGLTTGQQNLQALLNTQQLGAQTGLQAQLANQAAQLQAQQQRLNQSQAAQQAQEQSRQFGANLGLQGLQQKLSAAGQLGGFGQNQFDQQLRALQAQQTGGTQMRNIEQQRLDAMYQDFLAQRQYPQQQANFLANIIRGGSPATQTTSSSAYTPSASPWNTIGGLAGMYLANKYLG